jgi:hypothetical protein
MRVLAQQSGSFHSAVDLPSIFRCQWRGLFATTLHEQVAFPFRKAVCAGASGTYFPFDHKETSLATT